MKTKVLINILKRGIHSLAFILIFTAMLQANKDIGKFKIEDIEEITIAENIQEIGKREKQIKVTDRHSIIRNRKTEDLAQEKMEEVEQIIEQQYAKIQDIIISKDMDLTVRTGISREDFKQLISNVKYDTSKFFYDNSDMIYDLCEEYQINEIFFCGLIVAESGWSIAPNHRRTHNYISLMTKNGLIQYNSVEEGLQAAAKALHNNYLTEGGRFYNGKTLYGVKTRFCPVSSTWVDLVYGRMQQIMNCI